MLSRRTSTGKKRVLILVFCVVLIIALYTGGWFFLASRVKAHAISKLAALNTDDIIVHCENLHMIGYPLHITTICDHVSWERPTVGMAFLADRFTSGISAYFPRTLSNEITGPALINIPGLVPMTARWTRLTSTTQLEQNRPVRFSIDATDLDLELRTQSTGKEPLANIDKATLDLHNSDSKGPQEVLFAFSKLTINPKIVDNIILPELTGNAYITLSNGAALLVSRSRLVEEWLHGQSGEIKQAMLAVPGGTLTVSGPFIIDENGIIDATLQLTVTNIDNIAWAIKTDSPNQKQMISAMLFVLSAMQKNDKNEVLIPITIKRSKITVGFIQLGTLPHL